MNKNAKRSLVNITLLFLCLLASSIVNAHDSSTAFLKLDQTEDNYIQGSWSVQYADMLRLINFDQDGDEKVRWWEIRNQRGKINDLLKQSIRFYNGNEVCRVNMHLLNNDNALLGQMLSIDFTVTCRKGAAPTDIQYSFLSGVDPLHYCVLELKQVKPGSESVISQQGIFSNKNSKITLAQNTNANSFWDYIAYGFTHILFGWDHLAFLLVLILSTVNIKQHAFGYKLSTNQLGIYIAFFTIAHFTTLLVNTLGQVTLPTRLTEPLIALTIAWAAWNFIKGGPAPSQWVVFGFGLVHALGFSSALAEWNRGSDDWLLLIFGFNLGVELAQILFLALVIAAINFASQTRSLYQGTQKVAYSILGLSAIWITEGALNITILPSIM